MVIVVDACPDFGSSKWVFICLSIVIFVTCVLIKEMFFKAVVCGESVKTKRACDSCVCVNFSFWWMFHA